MECESRTGIARLCYDTARKYSVDPTITPSWEKVALLLGTAAVETGLTRSVGGRQGVPGLGLWNIYLNQAVSVWLSLRYRWPSRKAKAPWKLFADVWLGVQSPGWFKVSQRDMRYLLVHDDSFASAMCGWLYMSHFDTLPENLTQIADLWYRNYPSDHAKLEPVSFMNAWSEVDCESLMLGLGYR